MARTSLLLSFLAAACLAACGSDAEPGSACKADLTCGGDLVCDFQSATPTCLAPEADLDNDGIVNGDDFCPATNEATNHDEDGDGQGDACDKCPIERYRASVVDGDKDGVTGACDPDAQDPGDKIVFFEPFAAANALSSWTLDDPSHFAVVDGALKVTVTAADPAAEAKHFLQTTQAALAAFTAYRVTDAAPAGVENFSRQVTIGAYDPAPRTGVSPVVCGAVSASGGAGRLSVVTGNGEVTEPLLSAFAVGEPYRLLMQTSGNDARCVQIRGDSSTLAATSGGGDLRPGLVLSLRSVFANYEYVLVVSSPAR